MAGSPESGRSSEAQPLVARFDGWTRILHWSLALPFLFLLLSGLTLYLPTVKAVHVGGFRLIPLMHVLVGIAFILSPIPLLLESRGRAGPRRDLRQLFSFDSRDLAWVRYALSALLGARTRQPPTGKFNCGQKANSVFSLLVTAGLMLTGAVLAVNFFTKNVFSASFVEQVFPFHDYFMLISLPVVAIHIYLGSLNLSTREAFRGITRGFVRRDWARAHHPLWLEEIEPPQPRP